MKQNQLLISREILTRTKIREILRNDWRLCAAAVVIIFAMSYFCRTSDSDALKWILAPTAWWAGILGGVYFEYLPHQGYINYFHQFLIAPSCAGSRFMLLTFLMLAFSFRLSDYLCGNKQVYSEQGCGLPLQMHRGTEEYNLPLQMLRGAEEYSLQVQMRRGTEEYNLPLQMHRGIEEHDYKENTRMRKEYLWFGFSIVFSYISTVFVNGIRIVVSIFLPGIMERMHLLDGWLTPDRLHTLIGTVTYFTFLCVIYLIASLVRGRIFVQAEKSSLMPSSPFLSSMSERPTEYGGLLVPVFWYLLIVLALPSVKRMYHNEWEGFGQYAALIVGVCGSVYVLLVVVGRIRRWRS